MCCTVLIFPPKYTRRCVRQQYADSGSEVWGTTCTAYRYFLNPNLKVDLSTPFTCVKLCKSGDFPTWSYAVYQHLHDNSAPHMLACVGVQNSTDTRYALQGAAVNRVVVTYSRHKQRSVVCVTRKAPVLSEAPREAVMTMLQPLPLSLCTTGVQAKLRRVSKVSICWSLTNPSIHRCHKGNFLHSVKQGSRLRSLNSNPSVFKLSSFHTGDARALLHATVHSGDKRERGSRSLINYGQESESTFDS